MHPDGDNIDLFLKFQSAPGLEAGRCQLGRQRRVRAGEVSIRARP